MAKCDLDECSLSSDIDQIKKGQLRMTKDYVDMNRTQAVFIQKVSDYMKVDTERETENKNQHENLFARTRLTVKWPHLATVAFVLSAIVTIVWKLASG